MTPSVCASSGRSGSAAPWTKPSWPGAGVIVRLASIPAAIRFAAVISSRAREAADRAGRERRQELVGDHVVLRGDPAHVRAAGQEAVGLLSRQQPARGAVDERVVLAVPGADALQQRGVADPRDRARAEQLDGRAGRGVVDEVERAVRALQRLELVEQLARLRVLPGRCQRDRADRRVVGPAQVGQPRGARVVGRDVVGADEGELGLARGVDHGARDLSRLRDTCRRASRGPGIRSVIGRGPSWRARKRARRPSGLERLPSAGQALTTLPPLRLGGSAASAGPTALAARER